MTDSPAQRDPDPGADAPDFDDLIEQLGAELPPLSRERIKTGLEAAHLAYRVDSELDISTNWSEGVVWYRLQGQDASTLFIFGWWPGLLGIDERLDVLEFLNEQHTERLWPMLHCATDDDGDVRVSAEYSVACAEGVSDAQLQMHLERGTHSVMSIFGALGERFPRALERAGG